MLYVYGVLANDARLRQANKSRHAGCCFAWHALESSNSRVGQAQRKGSLHWRPGRRLSEAASRATWVFAHYLSLSSTVHEWPAGILLPLLPFPPRLSKVGPTGWLDLAHPRC